MKSKTSAFFQLRAALLTTLLLAALNPCALAASKEPAGDHWKASAWTRTHPYFNQIGHKLGFGVLNFGTGWMALFHEPFRPGGFFKGFARGVGYTILYEAGGALHAVTFPFPFDMPLPRGGLSFEE